MPIRQSPDDAESSHQQLASWFLRRQNLSQWALEDEQAFQAWLVAEPENRRAHAQWELDWRLMDQMSADSIARLRAQVASDRAIAKAANVSEIQTDLEVSSTPAIARVANTASVAKSVELPTESVTQAPIARRQFLHRTFQIAGAGSVLASTGWFGWRTWQAQPVYEQYFQTRRGQSETAELPDGSTLQLDTNTSLQATYYRDRREIVLSKGQAFFSVNKDMQRPFVVTTADIRVTVTGTRFSVRNTPGLQGREAVEVVVEEGSVRVQQGMRNAKGEWQALPNAAVHSLTAAQQILIGQGIANPEISTVDKAKLADWRQQRVSFSNTPLLQAISELERYADTGIISIDPKAARLRLSGTFNPTDPEAVRRLLTGALPVRLHSQGAGKYHLAAR